MMIAGTSAKPNKPITNEEMWGFYLDDAKTATRYNKLLDAKEVIIELMDLAREEGFGEGLKFSVDLLKCNIDAHKAQKKKEKEQ